MSWREMKYRAKARAVLIWSEMNDSEKHGVRFGLFPADAMKVAEADGIDGHELAVELMDCAAKDGGMRA